MHAVRDVGPLRHHNYAISGEGDGKNRVWALHWHKCFRPTLMITAAGMKTAAVNVFSNPQIAQFLAAAVLVALIQKLHGVPEVSEGGLYFA